jgi:hypothetical protein
VSKSEDDRLGLGWEVWFLIAMLAIGSQALILVPLVFGAAMDIPSPASGIPSAPAVDFGRLLAGGGGAVFFGVLASWLIRTTDWRG